MPHRIEEEEKEAANLDKTNVSTVPDELFQSPSRTGRAEQEHVESSAEKSPDFLNTIDHLLDEEPNDYIMFHEETYCVKIYVSLPEHFKVKKVLEENGLLTTQITSSNE